MPVKTPDFITKLIELEPQLDNYSRKSYIDHNSRWYYRETLDFLNHMCPKTVRILDLGCGYGTLGLDLHRRGWTEYYGVDKTKDKIDVGRKLYIEYGVSPQHLILQDLRNFEGMWDAIISMEVLYELHSADLQLILFRIREHLKPNGIAIFSLLEWEEEAKPHRTYQKPFETFQMLEKAGLEIIGYVPTPMKNPTHKNHLYVVRIGDVTLRRKLLVTVDGDGFWKFGEEFNEKVLKVYPFKFTASLQVNHLTYNDSRHETALETLSDPKVEVACHSWDHPKDWTEADATHEIDNAVDYMNCFMAENGVEKEVRGFLWTGDCNPTEEDLRHTDDLGLYNLNGKGWEEKPYLKIGERNWYLQRGFHDTWWQNRGQGDPWDEMAINFFLTHPERPIHLYVHYTCVRADRWPSTKRIFDWVLEQFERGRLESVWGSEYIASVKEDYGL